MAWPIRSSNKGRVLRRTAALAVLLLTTTSMVAESAYSQGSFDRYDIRVIRPKYMAKRGRVELGAQGLFVMNQAFIYTLLASGILDYHFTEMFAFEVAGSFGFSIDKEDKRILEDKFDIKTQILRTQYLFTGGVLWTPIYGKTQLPSGDLVYFDSFLTAQVGMTGIEYNYEQCITPPGDIETDAPTEKPSARTVPYPTLSLGFGQKYFISQNTGLRWDVRSYSFSYGKVDGTCDPTGESQGSALQHNMTLQFGASTFF